MGRSVEMEPSSEGVEGDFGLLNKDAIYRITQQNYS